MYFDNFFTHKRTVYSSLIKIVQESPLPEEEVHEDDEDVMVASEERISSQRCCKEIEKGKHEAYEEDQSVQL